MTDPLGPVDPERLHRHGGPNTSRKAAFANPGARLSQEKLLLKAHGDTFVRYPDTYDRLGLICDEAWLAGGGIIPTLSCYWHRHSSLADDYEIIYLERIRWQLEGRLGDVMERIGRSGHEREIFRLTTDGLDYYEAHLQHWNPLTDDSRWRYGTPPFVWHYPLA